MLKNILTCCILIFVYFNSYAFNLFNNKLNLYHCPTESDATNCTNCKIVKDWTMQVEVNVDNSVVIVTFYEDKKNLGSNALENCKIVDKKNWRCGHSGTYDSVQNYSEHIQTMSKGMFYSILRSKSPGNPRFNLTSSNFESLHCAK